MIISSHITCDDIQGLNFKNSRGAMKSSPGSVRRAIQLALLRDLRGAILYEQKGWNVI